MNYLIDTDWTIDYLNGSRRAIDFVAEAKDAGSHLGISLITFGEVYDGIYYGRDPKHAETEFHELLRVVNVIDLDEDIMRRFARIRGALRQAGQPVGDSDIMIAATAIHYGLILVTRNLKDFRRIPGLKLYDPQL